MFEIVKKSRSFEACIERDNDGLFHVNIEGQEVLVTRVLSLAEITYQEELDRLNAASLAKLAAERSHFDMQAVRSDSFARRTANARKTGGRGGRGGV